METLINLPLKQLRQRWLKLIKSSPPPRASREYLIGHITWQMQVEQYGGLTKDTQRQLKRLTQQLEEGKALVPQNTLIIKPGTKLLREYQGVKHEVIVADGSYRYQGKEYSSLSSIAREITGTRWNGKLFFGIKS